MCVYTCGTCVHVRMHISVFAHPYMHRHIGIRVYTRAYTYIHVRTYMCEYACLNKRTRASSQLDLAYSRKFLKAESLALIGFCKGLDPSSHPAPNHGAGSPSARSGGQWTSGEGRLQRSLQLRPPHPSGPSEDTCHNGCST